MKLKKIEIQGFKSFADKTEIVFLDGVTTIVGPNGSGKSNISDAVRWVLGEQSVKNLRGLKMEDVIFSGTQARKRVGFAEVSLYLDNTDETLPVDFKEVVVTRRVYRTGESNYLINSSECRLKDIQELFMDTGVGKDGYSIISQGKIDEILSSKSDERRHIFEEASGIVKYRTRKDEATRKLDNTNNSLVRVIDILTEIENTLVPLEEKANVAKKYLKLRDELKLLDAKIFLNEVRKNAETLTNIDDMLTEVSEQIQLCEQDTVQIEKAKLVLKEKIESVITKIEETQNTFFDIKNQIEKLNSNINLENLNIQNSNKDIGRLELEITQNTEKVSNLQAELQTKDEKKENMLKSKEKFEVKLKEKLEELTKITKTLDSKGLEIEKLKAQIDANSESIYNIKIENSTFETKVEVLDQNIAEKNKYLDKLISSKDSITVEIEEQASKVAQIRLQQEEKAKVLNEKIENFELNRKKLEEVNENKNNLEHDIMVMKSKLNFLENLEKEKDGYQKSVKEILNYSKENSFSDVYGTIADIISTDEKYEYAIEIALGGFVQNIVVNDEIRVKQLINYLNENKLGRVTFLPLNNIKKVEDTVSDKILQESGVIAMAKTLVNYDSKFENVIALSLLNCVVVDNIDNAISLSKKVKFPLRIVTLEGELILTTGSITGGKTLRNSNKIIGRADKIQKLRDNIDVKQKEFENIAVYLNELRKNTEIIDLDIQKAREELENVKIEYMNLENDYNKKKNELDKFEQNKSQAFELIRNFETEKKELVDKQQANLININELETQNTELKVTVEEYARFNREEQKNLDILNEDIVNLKISVSSFNESSQSIEEMKEKITNDINSIKLENENKVLQIEEFKQKIIQYNENIEKLKLQIEDKNKFNFEHEDIINKLKETKKGCSEKKETLEIKLLENVKKIEGLKEKRAKLDNRKVKFNIEIENLKNKIWEDYEMTISSAKALVESSPEIELSESKINKKALEIRMNIKELGQVDVNSIEEYQKTKERFEFISNQKEDLEQTKEKLENLISNMTNIMKQQFSKQFAIIGQNFDKTFKELFGGGRAKLTLSDEKDILNSGIEIEVEPPGKKLQSMTLLSGGERALTATALLFAILQLKSPPFCILDEIEAALDDVNVNRFAEYIKKYSDNTQFIVITHRKGTMEVASSVYGVTMQEYGISNIISMRLK